MDISALTHQMIILFAVIFVAYFASKAGLLPIGANKTIANLIINITCPATILYAIATASRDMDTGDVLWILFLGTVIHLGMFLFAWIAAKLMKLPKERQGVYRAMLVMANVAFLGFPVIRSLFGTDGLFIATLYSIPFNIIGYTYGVSQISPSGDKKQLAKEALFTPMLACSVLGLILYLGNIQLPQTVLEVLKCIDGITSPGSMVAIGCALATIPLKNVFNNPRVYLVTALRLIGIPIIVWAILGLFIQDEMLYGVLVTLTALPTATTVTLLCSKYDVDVDTSSAELTISTLASVVTLPLLLQILF